MADEPAKRRRDEPAVAENASVHLNVGGHRFTTLRGTLENSPTFAAALQEPDGHIQREADGSYFVDRDPEIFAMILCFLR